MHAPYRPPDRPTVYPSEIDLWLAVLLMVGPFITVGLGLISLIDGNLRDTGVLFGTGLLVAILTGVLTLPCRYTLDEEMLRIRCGIIGFKIPLAEVEQIETSSSWLSAPALSLKRVRVVSKRKTCLISPVRRDEFMADLQYAVEQAKSREQRIGHHS